jgi:hypothetical protein
MGGGHIKQAASAVVHLIPLTHSHSHRLRTGSDSTFLQTFIFRQSHFTLFLPTNPSYTALMRFCVLSAFFIAAVLAATTYAAPL